MRFNNSTTFRISTYLLKKKDFQKYFMTILNLSSTEVKDIFDMNKHIVKFSRQRIIRCCMMFRKYNVNVRPLTDLHYSFLLRSSCLEHRINTLKDIGVPNLSVTLINKMVHLFCKHLPKFKEIVRIPPEQSITKNIFTRLGTEIPNNISELESHKTITIKQYYEECLTHCKTEIFNLPYLSNRILLQNYGLFKSASMMAETLKVLRTDLGYDDKMIKKYPFVITASAENIKLLLNTFDNIYGIPIVTLLRNHPILLFQDVNNIKQLLISFKRYNISDKQVKPYIKIFNIDNDVFCERMEMMKRHPDLHIWLKHPRILDLILHINKTRDRVGFLHITNRIKWARPHTILSKRLKLEKFLQNSSSIVLSKKALRYMFMKELGIDDVDLVERLARHKHWKVIGFVEIDQMLKYLKKHFNVIEICQNIHIILYAQSKVDKLLADLKQQYSNSTEYSFTNNQYLALCLYMLEKENNFTDDGIWSDRCNAKQQYLQPLNFKNDPEDMNDDTSISDIDDLSIEDSEDQTNVNENLMSSNTTTEHHHT